MTDVSVLSQFPLEFTLSDTEKHVSYFTRYVRKKERMQKCIRCAFLISEDWLPDLGEGHVGVDVLETGLVSALHVCELGKEQLLLGIG